MLDCYLKGSSWEFRGFTTEWVNLSVVLSDRRRQLHSGKGQLQVCSKGKTQGSASGELLCLLHEELIVFSKLR
ncbi:hypothetical protein LWI28_000563 [Acer negundo]|uniref:Uncharacterized protein n=1 Tax=Acer negundo TaxID=4023 RepID=A0AAD5JHQ9_ACENE|nr:hypothetical protein LWI28_000563 [Acer negundo]